MRGKRALVAGEFVAQEFAGGVPLVGGGGEVDFHGADRSRGFQSHFFFHVRIERNLALGPAASWASTAGDNR